MLTIVFDVFRRTKKGTIVKSVQAKDADSNALTRLVYSLSGPEAHLFELEPTSGLLKVAPCATPGEHDCLDFEHSSKFELNVTADDGHGLSSSVPLEIQLLDANDHSPRFDVERVDVHVDEGSSEFERPLLLNATDADSSSLIVYSLELDSDPSPIDHNSMGDHRPADHFTTSFDDEPAASDLFTQPEIHQRSAHLPYNSTQAVAAQFAIDSRSGQIRLNRPIAYSAEPIRLKVRASDGVHSAFMRLHVHVRDTNDNAPYFRPIIRKLNVSELASRGDFVTQLRAQDADVGENARVSYSLHHPPADWRVESELAIDCRPLPALPRASDHFMIDEQSGVLSVSSALDFDLKAQYTLLVRARDHGQPARCGHALLHVHVLNENNKPPRLTPEVQLWHVPERTGLGSHVYTIEATDPDYTHSTFGPTLGSPPQLVFRIESVEAIDRRGNALTVGSLELQQVSRFFGVDPGGRVIVAQPLKHELAAQVILNVSVLDSGAPVPQVGYGQVRLTIDDYNDHAPVFDAPWTPDQPMYWFDVPEEQPIGTPLARLHAEDPDSRVARYVIEPNSSQFAIDQHTGQIVITSRLDYEAIDETHLQFNVVAYDDGNPRLSSMAMVHVRLQNINDHRPQFDRTEYEVTIDEHIDWNTAVLRVHAHDADKGMYGKVRYALSAPTSGTSAGADLSNGDALQFFYIEPETGKLSIVSSYFQIKPNTN